MKMIEGTPTGVADGDTRTLNQYNEGREPTKLSASAQAPLMHIYLTGDLGPETWSTIESLERFGMIIPPVRDREGGDGIKRTECVYTPHSLRATAATLPLDSGVDIMQVKELLGHRHVTTTQIYDKRRRSTPEGASHNMPL